jgi:hypothetical protein
MIKDNKQRVNFWRGAVGDFSALGGRYIVGCVYFVTDGVNVGSSESGIIYLAVSPVKCIRFGSFSKEENIDEKIKTIIEEKTEIHVHEWYGDFPQKGEAANLYISREAGSVHRWDPNEGKYKVIGGYEAGDGIEIKDGVISVTMEGEGNGFFEQVKKFVDDELEQAMEQVPVIHVISATEVERLCDEAWGTTSNI